MCLRCVYSSRVLLLLLSISIALLCSSCRKASTPSERKVVLYCSVDQAVAEPLIAEFEKKTGIKVETRFDTEANKTLGLVQKLRLEKDSPSADVFWSSEIFHTIRLADEGLAAPYSDAQTAGWPKGYADPRGRWYGFALRLRVIAYSTARVKAADAPRKLEDLLDARWKNRIAMPRPLLGTTAGDVASWFAHYGKDKATAILHGLAANRVRMTDSNSASMDAIKAGQADVAMTDSDDVFAAQANGVQVAFVPLDQGGDGALAIPNTAMLVANARHPDAAKELMAFLLSKQTEMMLARSESRNYPILSKPKDLPQGPLPRTLKVPFEKIAAELNASRDIAREILP